MKCAICGIRKPRRYCPGVRGDICTICCGTEREQSVDCPLDCTYLREAHQYERLTVIDPATIPNTDIRVTDSFLMENELLVGFLGNTVFAAALETPGATDFDVREALEALIKTYRTLESGLYYETRPDNIYAANIVRYVQSKIQELKEQEQQERGMSTVRDSAILGVLAFLQRLEYGHNNGRKRSKGFLDFLSRLAPKPQPSSELALEPDAQRIIL